MEKVIIEWAVLLLTSSVFLSIRAFPRCIPCGMICSPQFHDLSSNYICTKRCDCDNNEAFEGMTKSSQVWSMSHNSDASIPIDDMKIDPNVRALLEKSVQIDGKPVISQTTGGATKDAGHEDHVLRWEYPGNGTVKWRIPYIIGNVSASMTTLIEEVIVDYEANICMEFVERTTEQSYIHFIDDGNGGCWSYVGRRVEGVNYINLEAGCLSKGTVIHEIMHAMGFFHEHQRPDRDNYIIVNWDEIESSARSNFFKIDYQFVDNYIVTTVPYDFGSVMHYPDYAFSTSGVKTLTDLNGNGFTVQRSGFATSDILQLQLMFQCEGVMLPSTSDSSRLAKANFINHAAILTMLIISEFSF